MTKMMRLSMAVALAATMSAASALDLDSDAQKVGYTIGADMGSSMRQFGGDDIDLESVIAGLKAAYQGEDLALTPEQMETAMTAFSEARIKEMEAELSAIAEQNSAEGKAFLDENKDKEGVKTTDSGLQYKVLNEGEGAQPAASDEVTVNYEGRLIDGTVFDSSYERGEPVTFTLDHVIPGWTEGLQLMKEGSKYTFFIPSDLAYGEQGAGPQILPNSTLIFDVELLKVGADEAASEEPSQ